MFPTLPPFTLQTDEAREQARQLGVKGGPIDALDILTDPVQSILNPAVFSPNNPDNPAMTAGMTFLGQFLDHDITLDLKSPLLENSFPSADRDWTPTLPSSQPGRFRMIDLLQFAGVIHPLN